MKAFSTYQHLEGFPMTDRDKLEAGSKFWNEGKWENFVVPLLPKDAGEMSLIDVGCNAGLFCALAEDYGFGKVFGVDSDKEAIDRGMEYRDKIGGKYELIEDTIQNYLENVPVVDYTLLVNAHYYFTKEEWAQYTEELRSKTAHVIIVTAKKKPSKTMAATDPEEIIEHFKDWEQVGDTVTIEPDGTPHARKLWALCFKNPEIERVAVDAVDNGNAQQRDFLKQLDEGVPLQDTDYYRRYKDYRRRTGSKQQVWTEEQFENFMNERVELYKDIREHGMWQPVEVDDTGRLKDGNHRHDVIRHLGYKTILIKKV
jgi:SAM-dependent methyltransferase